MENGTLPLSRLLEMWSTSRPWAESRNPPPLGIFVDHIWARGIQLKGCIFSRVILNIDFYKVSCASLDIFLIG